MRTWMAAWMAAVLVASAAAGTAAGASITVPGSAAGAEGSDTNEFPFDLTSAGFTSMRYQQVYARTQFAQAGFITAILFRPDAVNGHAFTNALLTSVQINLSTTAAGVGSLSGTFGNNLGADDTVVFSGPMTLSSAFTGPTNGPKDFDIVINVTPFWYDPALGNLLMDVRNFNAGSTSAFDAVAGSGVMARVWNGNVAFPSNSGADDTGLVTQFQMSPVPEAAHVLAAAVAALAAMALARRRLTRPSRP